MSEMNPDPIVEESQNTSHAGEATDAQAGATSATSKRKRKKWPIVVGVIAAVLVVAGIGLFVWHEQPSFCSAICHTPMDPHGATYDQVVGQPGVDKWGNTVEDAGDLLVVKHKEYAGATCMSCHTPVMSEQVSEGLTWVTGNYTYPLEERSLTDLNGYNQHETEEGFCLNENCHNMTREDLIEATSGLTRNVHEGHATWACSDCHKAHRQSVNVCTGCHSDAYVPDGWLTVAEATKLEDASTAGNAA